MPCHPQRPKVPFPSRGPHALPHPSPTLWEVGLRRYRQTVAGLTLSRPCLSFIFRKSTNDLALPGSGVCVQAEEENTRLHVAHSRVHVGMVISAHWAMGPEPQI